MEPDEMINESISEHKDEMERDAVFFRGVMTGLVMALIAVAVYCTLSALGHV